MSCEWPLQTLDSLTTEVTVGYVGTMSNEYVDKGIPFLRSLNVNPFLINPNDLKFISSEFHSKLKKSTLRPGDVVIVRTGKPGTCAVIPEWLEEANCSDLVIVRCGPNLRPHFLSYWVNSVATHHVSAHLVGAVQQHFNVGAAKTMLVASPSLNVQDQVLSILRALDDRIALLRETNATLEAIAQALFKSWFVDFDPVHARARGEQPAGLAHEVAALFPDSFEESELGMVPKGWGVQPIRDVVEGVYDGPHATPPESDVGPVFLGIKNLTGTALDLSDVRHIADEDFIKWTKRVTPKAGDIVFSYEATLGFFALIPDEVKCCLGRRLALIRPMAIDGHGHFWFHQFVAAPFQRHLDKHTIQGATVNRIALKEFPGYPVLNPPSELKQAFEVRAAAIWHKIHLNQKQAQTLANLRDTLLPRLISGQLRLPDAEAQLSEVGLCQ